jgi:hypothetical protein
VNPGNAVPEAGAQPKVIGLGLQYSGPIQDSYDRGIGRFQGRAIEDSHR